MRDRQTTAQSATASELEGGEDNLRRLTRVHS